MGRPEEALGWLDAEPGLSAKEVLARLRGLAPERFQDTQLRTVQRAVKAWRARSAREIILGGVATLTSLQPVGSDGRAFGVAHSSTGATTTTTPTIHRMADPNPPELVRGDMTFPGNITT